MRKIIPRADATGFRARVPSPLCRGSSRRRTMEREVRRMCRGRSIHQGGGLVSLRSSLWRYLGLLVIAALAVGVFAGPASAKKLNAKQQAHARKQLRKQIKKNPRLISSKRFIKRAALVNFKLPVTLRLRGGNTPGACNGLSGVGNCQPTPGIVPGSSNPNTATVDLGASLGSRSISLGGKLAAEVVFRDSYDGGALGNVDLNILPSTTKGLTSTSIPLLWNDQVTQGVGGLPFTPGAPSRYDANDLYLD